MDYIFQLKKKNFNVLIISFLVSLNFFFWDVKLFGGYGLREAISLSFFLIVPNLWKNNFNYLKSNKKNFIIIFSILTLILFHQIINSYIDKAIYTKHNFLGILGLYFLCFFIYFYYEIILNNLNLIVKFFLIVLLFSYFFTPIERSSDWEMDNLCNFAFQFKNTYIFVENSHFGMMVPPVIGYILYSNRNKSFLFTIVCFAVILLICLLELSATLIFSFFVTFSLILFLDYKYFFKKNFIYLILISLIFINLNKKNQCFIKMNDTANGMENILTELHANNYKSNIVNKKEKLFMSKFLSKKMSILNSKENSAGQFQSNESLNEKFDFSFFDVFRYEDEENMVSKDVKYTNLPTKGFGPTKINLSSSVLINAFNISLETILSRPLGWGLNRYENAFDFYMFNNIVIPYVYHEVYTLNYNDASANFPKIFTEFGIFSLILIPFFIIFLFSKKMSIEHKILFLGIICTQLIRGAGYYNGGFMFSLIIILFSVLNLKKN